jgi:hypothetical protein
VRVARRIVVPAAGVAIALTVLVWAYAGADAMFGPRVDRAMAHAMPEFGADGRAEFFGTAFPRFWFRGPSSGVGAGVAEAVATVLGSLLLLCRVASRRHAVGVALLVAGVVSFFAAHATLFALHLPNRYVSTIWPVAQTMGVALVVPREIRRDRTRSFLGGLVFLGCSAAAVGLVGFAIVRTPLAAARALGRVADEDQRALHAFLATLRKDALVAAFPTDADAIPLRARRSVLASDETAQPYWLGYYGPEKARLEASLRACYATSWTDLDAFAARERVTVFVANADAYDERKRAHLRQPFGSLADSLYAAGKSTGFSLGNPPADRVLFRRGRFTVVRLSPR